MISRKDLQWIDLCMSGAKIFSTCAKRQFFCVIVSQENQIVGQGYNGVPSGMTHCENGGCPRFANNVPSGTPYDYGPGLCYSAHAEQNALSRSDSTQFSRSTLYVNGLPCLTCAKMVASSGIPRLVLAGETDRIDWSDTSAFLMEANLEVEIVGG